MNKVYSRCHICQIGMTCTLLTLLILSGCKSVEHPPTPAPAPASVTTVPEIKPAPQKDTSTLKVSNTPLGMYDLKVIESIKNNWTELVENAVISGQKSGLVKVSFRLHPDGQISEVTVTESTGSTIQVAFCKMAIEKSAPLPPWPEELREKIGKDYRDVTFTFKYQ